jgi:hypothetical protein
MYRMLKTDEGGTNEGFPDFMMENFLSLADKISDVLGQKTGDSKNANTLEQKVQQFKKYIINANCLHRKMSYDLLKP